MGEPEDHVDLFVVLAHLTVIVEVHMGEDEAAVSVVAADARWTSSAIIAIAALLEQLVVDGLVQVAEHVHVAPAELDADALLESRRTRAAV